MKIKVFYENGSKEIIDSVKSLGIVGSKISKDGHILHQIAIRFDDDYDSCILNDVRRIDEV